MTHIPASKEWFYFHPDADKTHRMTTRMLDEVEKMCHQIDIARGSVAIRSTAPDCFNQIRAMCKNVIGFQGNGISIQKAGASSLIKIMW